MFRINKHIILLLLFLNSPAAFVYGADTLAVIGSKVITADYFTELYKQKLLETGIQDNNEVRVKYLKNLVDDELLIYDAKQKGYTKIDSVKKEIERLRLQELLNIYSIAHISPAVNITDEYLKELFTRLNTRIKVRHIYANTRNKADSLYVELKKGRSFEELAAENFTDPVLKNNGGLIGYISADDTDPEFEKAAFSLRVGEISAPVKTVQGYSIIKVEDIQANPLVTESEFLKAKSRLMGFARKRKFEEASKEFAGKLHSELNPQFDEKGLEILFTAIKENSNSIAGESPVSVANSDMDMPVVTSRLGVWNISKVLEEMELVTDRQISLVKTIENLEEFISGLINRSYIKQKAVEEGLADTEIYRKKADFVEETYLLTLNETDLKEEIIITEDSIKTFYENNKSRFVKPAEMRLSSILVDDFKTADTVVNLLSSGMKFEEVARKYSIQSNTAEKGGDMGYFKKEELDNLGTDIFNLPEGKWGGPYTDNGKYLFLKNTEYVPGSVKTFDEVKAEIKNTLTAFSFYNRREQYTGSLKEKIKVLVFPEKLKSIKLTTNS